MSLSKLTVCLSLVALCTTATASAAPIVIDFESFNDFDLVTTQIPGITFSDTAALQAGVSLNELELPPHSGTAVAFDFGGPISIMFDVPVYGVGGYFTHLVPVSLEAFDASNNSLGVVTSAFSDNLALSGDAGSSPNEFLQFSSSAGIESIVITGDPFGGSLTLDDLTIEPVPEPATLGLVMAGAIAALRKRRVASFRGRRTKPSDFRRS
jgi:hypothetical protein